ncbi:MAG TPA: cytochrome P450, partial [Thermoleophilaceae bacterium]
RITLDGILRAVFGVHDGERMDLYREAIPKIADATGALDFLPLFNRDLGPWSRAGKFRRALAGADRLIYEEIELRRSAGDVEERDDVLSLLLAARHEDGSPMTDVELRDQLMTLITAGHETSATGLSWAFERLLRTPRVLERLTADLDDDAYLDAVVKETLRSRPVILDVARLLKHDTEIGGYTLPAGTTVLAAIAAMHARSPAYPDWAEFRPERFLEAESQPYTWIPFGGGVRRCIGAVFAQTEMKIVLREVLRRVRLRADRERPESPRIKHVTVVPSRGARVVVSERLEPLAETADAEHLSALGANAPG